MTNPLPSLDRLNSKEATETRGIIFDLKRFAVHDGPGIRSVVFFKGCPLHCAWCHNPEGIRFEPELVRFETRCTGCAACVDACPQAAHQKMDGEMIYHRARCEHCGRCVEACYSDALFLYGRKVRVADVMAEIRQDADFYQSSGGGVTLSGGEPLAQPAFAIDLLRQCKAEGFSTALDTSGNVAWPVLETALTYTDLVLYDLKLIDPVQHQQYTRVSNTLILENLRRLDQRQVPLEIRIPFIPTVTGGANLEASAALLAGLAHPVNVRILPYHRLAGSKYQRLGMANRMPAVETPDAAMLQAAAAVLKPCGHEIIVG